MLCLLYMHRPHTIFFLSLYLPILSHSICYFSCGCAVCVSVWMWNLLCRHFVSSCRHCSGRFWKFKKQRFPGESGLQGAGLEFYNPRPITCLLSNSKTNVHSHQALGTMHSLPGQTAWPWTGAKARPSFLEVILEVIGARYLVTAVRATSHIFPMAFQGFVRCWVSELFSAVLFRSQATLDT